jgi:hypothetical protein
VRRNSPRGAQGGLRDWLVFAMIAEEYARAAWRL